MLRFLRSLFAWETVRVAGVYLYQENRITGARRAIRRFSGGHSPVDTDWLEGLNRVPVVSPCTGWLCHNVGICDCYRDYPVERESRRRRECC